MKFKSYLRLSILVVFVLFTGCSKEIDEYNKPAMYWYSKMIEQVSNGDIERADEYYASLQGEHISSPLLPQATIILAIAHMYHEEYLLSEHFLDEYIKRYATSNEKEEADFLKIKAKYLALPNPRRDQALIAEAIKSGESFKKTYPESMYLEIVETILTRLYLAQAVLNETISSLYDRIDKPKAAEYYRNIKPEPWIVWDDVNRANTPWYREWFEGDGTSSWYEFMIPEHKSVVSRNSNKEEDMLEDDNKTVEKKIEDKEPVYQSTENNSSWYDFMNPWSADTKEDSEPKEEPNNEAEKEESDTSWYDFWSYNDNYQNKGATDEA